IVHRLRFLTPALSPEKVDAREVPLSKKYCPGESTKLTRASAKVTRKVTIMQQYSNTGMPSSLGAFLAELVQRNLDGVLAAVANEPASLSEPKKLVANEPESAKKQMGEEAQALVVSDISIKQHSTI